ncbi:MAG: hypothetical protein ACRD9R_11385 [Pyrinomonadaceae bacterium]
MAVGTEQRKGFGGQWVEIFQPGRHLDSKGRVHELGADFVELVAANFNTLLHEPPATIGHPEEDAPAYGWVSELRVSDTGKLEALFCDTDEQFESMVREGKFKKRSSAFYLDESVAPGGHAPALRHVAFLGAQPPAVKGLKNIHFGENEALIFADITFSEGEISMEEKDVEKVAGSLWDKLKSHLTGGKENKPEQVSFSEADVRQMVNEAVKTATASFTETIGKQEKIIQRLEGQVQNQSSRATRADIVAFCERLGAEKFPPALKRGGVIEFMETLAALPADEKVTVVSFSEKDGQRIEQKTESAPLAWFQNFLQQLPPFIAFGEHFNGLNASGAATPVVDPARVGKLLNDAGVKTQTGGDK